MHRFLLRLMRLHAPVAILFALILTLALPIISFAQGRGNGRGRGQGQGPNLDKKCAKFVNCHDARDGRWDGRGPGGNQVSQWPGVDIFRNRRVRRDRDDEIFNPRSRNRRVDRDGDGDVDRDDARRRRQDRSDRIESRERRTRRN